MTQRILFNLLLLFIFINVLHANLIDYYKKGIIKLSPCRNFGENTDWETLFFDSGRIVTVATDGSIFVLNKSRHNFFKFDSNGRLIGTYGRAGNGPGDLWHPDSLTILDEKYLVIGEYSDTRRISIFDFSGKCIKVVKTNHPPFNVIALKNNKIAFFYYLWDYQKNPIEQSKKDTKQIIIKDITNGEEITIDTITIERTGVKRTGEGAIFQVGKYNGEVYLSQTNQGELLVGISNTPYLKVFDVNGKLIRTITLKTVSVPVTEDYIEKTKQNMIRNAVENLPEKVLRLSLKELERYPLESAFGKFLPYYRDILLDSEGNILIYKWTDCVGDCTITFQVYSPEGNYICDTRIDEGIFTFNKYEIRESITIMEKGIFALVELRKSEDFFMKLIKLDIK